MQIKRGMTSVLVAAVLAMFGPSHASALQLSVRPSSGGEFEAVIRYDAHLCNAHVNPASSVERSGNTFNIVSPEWPPGACLGPIPPFFVEVVAPLGELEEGEYTVSWVQPGMFDLSTQYVAASSAGTVFEIPAMGFFGALMLIAGIVLSLRLTMR